jgi:hypothetical protein
MIKMAIAISAAIVAIPIAALFAFTVKIIRYCLKSKAVVARYVARARKTISKD